MSFLLVLGGCAARQPQVTQAQQQFQDFSSRMVAAGISQTKCYDELAKNPDVQKTFSEIIIQSPQAANRFDLIGSNIKLSEAQKKVFKNYLSQIEVCKNEYLQNITGTPFVTLTQGYYGAMDIVHANLLSGKSTIGQASTSKMELNTKHNADFQAIAANIRLYYENSNAAELNKIAAEDDARRSYWANAMQGMGQAFRNNAQYYQNQNNQLINNNQNRAPTTTRCNQWGSQINCTSQ